MRIKKITRNLLLLAVLVVGVIIVSAQVGKQQRKSPGVPAVNTDAVKPVPPPPDNTEGLAELNKIIDRYKGGNLMFTGEINYYANIDSSSRPQERTTFTSINTAGSSSYEIDSVQTIIANGLTVIIDKQEKSMAIIEQDALPSQETALQKDPATELQEFTGYIYSIEVKSKGNEKSLLILFKDDAPFNLNRYEIFYQADSYRILRVQMEMTDGDISETNTDTTANAENDELVYVDSANNETSTGYYARLRTTVYEVVYKSERTVEPGFVDATRFIKKEGDNQYVPAGPYKHYELIN